jgi:glycosyltransferase involved in cell wall biosynthesis
MNDLPTLRSKDPVDVLFLLEGTYPFVSGGVSSWVHEIITGLPELRFGVIFLGASAAHYDGLKYTLPPNLVHLETHFLMEGREPPPVRARPGDERALGEVERLHDAFRRRSEPLPEATAAPVLASLGRPGGSTARDFLYSEAAWKRIRASYQDHCTDPSFVDYFWTVRSMHAPLYVLAEIADRAPAARLVHAVSTGYAGFLGALLRQRRGAPFVLTEHGIYTKERRIDLAQAAWIKDAPGADLDDERYGSHIRELWIRFFEGLGRMAYASAAPIVSLYEGNRSRQIADGARAEKTMVVPNGVDVARFARLAERPVGQPPPVLGLIGRVVPIKDVGTFVRAMRVLANRWPDADGAGKLEGWIVGPDSEDPAYARECRELVASLGLTDRVRFLGFQRPDEILPRLGLTVLTSISEALPLVVLESFAAGVPVVTTDVGSCRELVEGVGPEDRALGSAGAVTPIATPEATAAAAMRLLQDPAAWAAARAAGIERVRRHYTRDQMFARYRDIYARAGEAVGHGGDRVRAAEHSG